MKTQNIKEFCLEIGYHLDASPLNTVEQQIFEKFWHEVNIKEAINKSLGWLKMRSVLKESSAEYGVEERVPGSEMWNRYLDSVIVESAIDTLNKGEL